MTPTLVHEGGFLSKVLDWALLTSIGSVFGSGLGDNEGEEDVRTYGVSMG